MYNSNTAVIQDKQTLLRTSSIIFLALIAGQVLFGAVVVFLNKDSLRFSVPATTDPFIILVPLLAVMNPIIGAFIYKSMIKKAKSEQATGGKFGAFLSATIVRFALIEGASLFAIVVTMLTNNLLYLAIAGVLVLYQLSVRPTADRIDTELDLTYGNAMDFTKKDSFN